jgi:hypothetical protein
VAGQIASTDSAVPSTGRPSGWPGSAVSWNWSKITSSGVSSAWPISCRMTPRSRCSSSGSNTELRRISAIISTPSATSSFSTEAW